MSTLTVSPSATTPQQDAMQLYRAFKGFGCDTATVVGILAHRDAMQRALIQQEYRNMYADELSNRLSSELSGDLKVIGLSLTGPVMGPLSALVERAVLLWMHDLAGRDATIVRNVFGGGTIDLKAAVEVICSRTSSQILTFKQAYHAKFGVHLENDISFQANGDLQKLLMAYVSITRYEGPEVDKTMVEKDASDLFKAGEKRLGTDEKTFMRIFSERSRAHLAAVSVAYQHVYGNSLKKAIKKETSGLFEFALLTILQCAVNPAKYFAKELHKAMKGLGTNDSTLIRIVVSRTEIDMEYIKAEYKKKYGKPLGDVIHKETSGHYRTFLLALVGPDH